MFIGHFAVALGAKKSAPKVSLGSLFMAAQFVDLLWPLLLLLGWEHVRVNPGNTVVTPFDFYDYPISHSLIGAVVWSCAFGAVYFGIRRNARNALILVAVVFSHWILDLVTHRPDLPLGFGGNTYFGLGLWNSLAGTMIAEVTLFAMGIAFYLQATKAKDRIGSIGFWSLAGIIALIYVGNLFGPPPPEASMIAIAGNASWLFVLWAYWVDKHREAKVTP
ncbi:MAG: hypothetical protein NTU47_09385 [Ignavibacteriales bacterium]|nr:hypothetical protein [Ignavibacteriales bacterium]